MRKGITILILAALCGTLLPTSFAATSKDDPLGCTKYQNEGLLIARDNAGSDANQCRINVCAALYSKNTAYMGSVRNYAVALDEPFEELLLRLKASLENFQEEMQQVCGSEEQPLPVCRVRVEEGQQVQLTNLGDEVTAIRADCSTTAAKMVEFADVLIRELLLRLAGDQRTHAYARRIDALAQEVRKINEAIALIVTYIKKISIPTVLGDPAPNP